MSFSFSSASAGTSSRRDVLGIGGGDVHRDLLDERGELIRARDEVRFAVHLDEHADLAAHVDVAADRALAGRAAGLLRRRGETPLAQEGRGGLDVAIGFGEGGFAFHEAGAGEIAQLLDELC